MSISWRPSIFYKFLYVDPADVELQLFQEKKVKTMAADVLF